MKNTKKVLSGVVAMAMLASFAACSDDTNTNTNTNSTGTTTEATTTTAVTVEVNTDTLKAEEQEALEGVMEKLQDVELENKEIKWLAHYSLQPDGTGQSKSVGLEMFEQKYGGTIKEYLTTYGQHYNDLSTYLISGEGIDFFMYDPGNFPMGVISGMFVPVDEYIDMNSDLWQYTKAGMELFNFGGRYFMFVTSVDAEYMCFYNTKTIEDNGFDDPWELWEKGEWNWDTFRDMLVEFADPDNDMVGLDNWFFEKGLYTSSGATAVNNIDGHIVSQLKDAQLAKAMEFGYDLYQNGCLIDMSLYNWSTQLQKMADGTELFDITGVWQFTKAPETWDAPIDPEYLGVVPVPSPAGSETYSGVSPNGYVLCKGATNPQGVALYAECCILGSMDEDAIAISDRKSMDDYKWSQEIVDRVKAVNDNARLHPVFEFAGGVSNDVATYTVADGGIGVRAPFHGSTWAEQVSQLADPVGLWVEEADNQLQAAIAEFN
ncbi:MAG: hypothetical protein J1F11_02950 [Oscillospiraceae bacterium]|nr:hypothetical protein [Oscillospiraceae bacterium]